MRIKVKIKGKNNQDFKPIETKIARVDIYREIERRS